MTRKELSDFHAQVAKAEIDALCVAYVRHISATAPGHVIPHEQELRGLLARLWEKAIATEKERCASVAASFAEGWRTADTIAAAIRAPTTIEAALAAWETAPQGGTTL